MLISELLCRQKENDKIAIKYGNIEISYRELYEKSKSLAYLILNYFNNSENHNVALFLPNSIDYAVAYFAVAISKNVIVPIGVQSKAAEIISTIDYCELDLIITSNEYREVLSKTILECKFSVSILFVEDGSIEQINTEKKKTDKIESTVCVDDSDTVAIMLHTSGTTSNPKRVMLTHNNLICNIESNIASLELSENDIVLISMPMHFGYCNTAQFLTHIYLGASIIIFDGVFWPKRFFEIIKNERVTNFTGVPSMLLMLLDYKHSSSYDISSLRYICFGGGNMPIDKLRVLINKFNTVGFVQTYGQTEASPRLTALMPKDSLARIGSVGKPIPNVYLKIYNDYGEELGRNLIGEIVAKGPNIMKGYYKQPELTEKALKYGWLHTGDLGYFDDNGYLYLTGRKKNMIISGGINIYPEEIEEVLMRHIAVSECCVISEEHSLLGEVPVAKVVLKDNNYSEMDFKNYLEKHLSEYKIPVRFYFVEALPKTYNGKIQRR